MAGRGGAAHVAGRGVPHAQRRRSSRAETRRGFAGALGTGSGKWQLAVSSEQAIEVMSLLLSARTEHGHHDEPFHGAGQRRARQGRRHRTVHTVGLVSGDASRLVRRRLPGVRADRQPLRGGSGEVRIDAIGRRRNATFGPVSAGPSMRERDEALQLGRPGGGGNADKGLSGRHRTGCRRTGVFA